MEVFWTVVAGVGVFVFGQVVVKFFVEPWHDLRMCIGRIAQAVVIYGQAHGDDRFVSTVPVEEARRELMSLSGELLQRTYAIPGYGLYARLFPRLASWQEIRDASGHLGGLAKSLDQVGGTRSEHIANIRGALRLHDPTQPLPVPHTNWHQLSKRLRRHKP
jgi:hypothetical protein